MKMVVYVYVLSKGLKFEHILSVSDLTVLTFRFLMLIYNTVKNNCSTAAAMWQHISCGTLF
jgi:hypothetical protein